MADKRNGTEYIVYAAIGVIVGCVFMNLLWRYGDYLVQHEHKYALSLLGESDTYRFFWKSMIAMLGVFLYGITLSSGFTSLGTVISKGVCFVLGIWWGSFGTECILARGIDFLIQIMKFLLMENFGFLLSYSLCLEWIYRTSRGYSYRGKRVGGRLGRHWKVLAFSVLWLVIWCICWSYVNLSLN